MNGRRDFWLAALVLVVTFALGFWLGRTDRRDSALPAASTPEPLTPSPQQGAIPDGSRLDSDLTSEIRGLRSDLAGAFQAGQERAALSSTPGTNQNELVAALRELAETLRQRPAELAGGPREGGLGVKAQPAASGFPGLGTLLAASPEEITRQHLFWSLQDVINRYGSPSILNTGDNGDLHAYYRPQTPDGRGRTFFLHEGQVIRVE